MAQRDTWYLIQYTIEQLGFSPTVPDRTAMSSYFDFLQSEGNCDYLNDWLTHIENSTVKAETQTTGEGYCDGSITPPTS